MGLRDFCVPILGMDTLVIARRGVWLAILCACLNRFLLAFIYLRKDAIPSLEILKTTCF
jgi:hypothetical protein